MPVTIHAELII